MSQNMVDFYKLFCSNLISSVSNQIFCTCVMYDSVPKIDGRPWCLENWLDLLNLPWLNWNFNRLNHSLGRWIKTMCCACVVDKCCSCVVWWMYDKANVQSKFEMRLITRNLVCVCDLSWLLIVAQDAIWCHGTLSTLAQDLFKCKFLNENFCILIKI